MRKLILFGVPVLIALAAMQTIRAVAQAKDYFPPAESKGGWRSALPATGEPDDAQKAAIAKLGVNYDLLKQAWEYNAKSDGSSGLLVIRNGTIVGEWYKDSDRKTPFNIYSSSKSYTSLAYGLLLEESAMGKLPGGKRLMLDTKVVTEEWLPEAFPLPDPRKADITLRHLLTMTSGIGGDALPTEVEPFEIALGKTAGSPFATLKGAPGETFNYSNAGMAHLPLLFKRAAGEDLYPYLKSRIFDPLGVENLSWTQIGGKDGKLGPLSQAFSGILTSPREHARYCYLALKRGVWDGKRVAPPYYYDFAWSGTKVNPTYGGLWWVGSRYSGVPSDMVETLGAYHNNGYVIPSMNLIFVRLGNSKNFPDGNFDQQLVTKVLAACTPSSAQWEKDIEAFEAADRKQMPPEGGTLFIGSSTTRMWKTLAQDFPDAKTINRGFGGSQIVDSVYYADRIVMPYKPKLIVLQVGTNDIASGKLPQMVFADYKAFVEKVRAKLPDVRIAFLCLNPSPIRAANRDKEREANRLILNYVKAGKNLDYIDLWDQFLDANGKAREELFLADKLHNNDAGYRIRVEAVRPHLIPVN